MATLGQTTTKIEILDSSIASLEEIYLNNSQVLKISIPTLFNTYGKHKLISGTESSQSLGLSILKKSYTVFSSPEKAP